MPPLDPRRYQLCGLAHSISVALRLCEDTECDHVVIQTAEPLQPIGCAASVKQRATTSLFRLLFFEGILKSCG